MPSECVCARVGARNCVLRGGAPGLPGEVTICGGGAPCDAAFCRNSSIASAAVLCWQRRAGRTCQHHCACAVTKATRRRRAAAACAPDGRLPRAEQAAAQSSQGRALASRDFASRSARNGSEWVRMGQRERSFVSQGRAATDRLRGDVRRLHAAQPRLTSTGHLPPNPDI